MAEEEFFLFRAITPKGIVLEKSVFFIKLPGGDGEVGVLPDHSPALFKLKTGKIELHLENEVEKYFVRRGMVEVSPGQVTLLTPFLEHILEIDLSRAQKAKSRAVERLKMHDEVPIDRDRAQTALWRAEERIQLYERHSKGPSEKK